jgi:serine/threonine protein kinase
VLADLSPQFQRAVERAAFEEFVSPAMFGSPRRPGVGDRVHVENERHYLVMQLRPVRGARQPVALPLSDLLVAHRRWPSWLELDTALQWGIQLCRIVARLHRMGALLGDLDPTTILVDSEGTADWAPLLLVSWPPASQFWPPAYAALSRQVFPIGMDSGENAFIAPEVLQGKCYEPSDIYSLGALLYLLFTRYAPISARLRMLAERRANGSASEGFAAYSSGPLHKGDGLRLIPAHLFNRRLSPRLEQILERALALDPAQRFASAFELVEALESLDPDIDFLDPYAFKSGGHRDSRMEKLVEWVKRELES